MIVCLVCHLGCEITCMRSIHYLRSNDSTSPVAFESNQGLKASKSVALSALLNISPKTVNLFFIALQSYSES